MYDIKNLREMKHLGVHAPEALSACVAFDKAVFWGLSHFSGHLVKAHTGPGGVS